jgi:hypothetical protein
MHRLYVLCEGQTEEAFVERVVAPYLLVNARLAVTPIVVATKRLAGGGKHRGGVTSWSQVGGDLARLLRDGDVAGVTTVIDLYGLPPDWPGLWTAPREPRAKVDHIEKAMADAVGDRRFVPHITLHEFEALVFACAVEAGAVSGLPAVRMSLEMDVATAGGPELVNEGPSTAPSKRLLRYWPSYAKTTDGPTIVERNGLAALRVTCPHLDAWITCLEGL